MTALLLLLLAQMPLVREDAEPGDWILVQYLGSDPALPPSYVRVDRWSSTPDHRWLAGLWDPAIKPTKVVDFKPDKLPLYFGKVEQRRWELDLNYLDAAGNLLAVYEKQRWPAGDNLDPELAYSSVRTALGAGKLPNQAGLSVDGVFVVAFDVKGKELGRRLVRR